MATWYLKQIIKQVKGIVMFNGTEIRVVNSGGKTLYIPWIRKEIIWESFNLGVKENYVG